MYSTVIVKNNGGEAKDLAAAIRKAGVFSMIKPASVSEDEIKQLGAAGTIYSNGFDMNTLDNTLFGDLKCQKGYDIESFVAFQVEEIRCQVGNNKVLLALSGGVDSSVCAALLAKAIPGQVVCVFVDHGLMRKNEGDEVEAAFRDIDVELIRVNAADRFFDKLKGETDPEVKRKIVGAEFIAVFREEAKKLGNIRFLAQGTNYADIIESGVGGAELVKSHHNVGGLPKELGFSELVEPLSYLFKDEVRAAGYVLGLPAPFITRQPFPGPGLCVRILGEVTAEKAALLQEADAIFRQEVDALDVRPSQYFAVHTGISAVGVIDGKRNYGTIIALRAINSIDFMTAEYTKIPHATLEKAAGRIITETPGVARVVYDVTSKPPGTVEWE